MGVNRSTMKEVSDELAKLKALRQKSWAQQNSEETDYDVTIFLHECKSSHEPIPDCDVIADRELH